MPGPSAEGCDSTQRLKAMRDVESIVKTLETDIVQAL